MLKALDIVELYLWSGRQSGNCHFIKGDWRERLDYLSVTCFNVQGKKLYLGADNKVQLNCSFHPGHAVDLLFNFVRLLRGSWEFVHSLYVCFVDFWKAYDHVPRETLLGVL